MENRDLEENLAGACVMIASIAIASVGLTICVKTDKLTTKISDKLSDMIADKFGKAEKEISQPTEENKEKGNN